MNPIEIEKNVLNKININDIKNYNLLDMHLHLTLQQIYSMFHSNTINRDEGHVLKIKAITDYTDRIDDFNFRNNMFKKHIDNIIPTEQLRVEFRKNPTIEAAAKLIEMYSGEPFNV